MPSFVNSAELKWFETGGGDIWWELIIILFQKDISKFLTLSILPTPFINSSVPDIHFRFTFLWESQQ